MYNNGTKYFHTNSTEADSVASGENSIAIGPKAVASGDGSVAQGYGATASATNAIAIGTNANASVANSVALGANSVADQANTVSVGSAGNERRITNVAPGIADTDGVNVSQLRGLGTTVLKQANNYADNIGRKAYGGVAAALAMESAPYIAGTWTYAAGVGYYQGEAAMAISVRRTADNNRWSITGGVTQSTHGGVGARLAVTGILGETN